MELIAVLIVGVLLGGAACWLIQESRAKSRLAQQEAGHRETAAGLRGQLEQVETAQKMLETAKEQLSDLPGHGQPGVVEQQRAVYDVGPGKPGKDVGVGQGGLQTTA